MLLKIFLASIVGILGLSGLLIGVISFFAMPEPNYLFSGTAFVIGLLVGPASFWYIIKLNRVYQDEALKAVLENPECILVQWGTDKERIILTKDELFVNNRYYPFKTYQKLIALDLIEKDTIEELVFEFRSIAQARYQPPKLFITVPSVVRKEATTAMQTIQQAYSLA